MRELDKVFEDYLPNSEQVVAGVKSRRKLTSGNELAVDATITKDLPKLIEQIIFDSGRAAKKYRIYGSVGQINWTLAYIPWVAILLRDITTSTERGYYVVLLFSQDMQNCFLSLNQGFTQFREAFGDKIGNKKIAQVARLAIQTLHVPTDFIAGPLDLAATKPLGKGYESGAIISRRYRAGDEVSIDKFRKDLVQLLNLYDELVTKLGSNLLDHLDLISSDDYQEAANEIATELPSKSLPDGGLPPPPKVNGKQAGKYKRNPEMAAIAIQAASHQCEVEPTHLTFTSRKTKKPFVEAHHLVPMQCQDQFEVSLDVPENIVALCPGCHRKFHHARFGELKLPLGTLLSARIKALKSRQIITDHGAVHKIYKGDVDED
ncbi:5-methylcytosine-specific restriction protein A [Bradyrhizobium sp. AZCC 2262]|uniref:MrcB family domain-containing protein n=1 Tax=Bradyrhizobium sp. AZCC 2262 TaxID=3117022 RepID=UPI002FF245B4